MVLYEGKRDALIGQLASRLTQDICDVYQHLGHSLRTPTEAIQEARGDAQVGTSLLESRLLLGNSEVYGRYSELMRSLAEYLKYAGRQGMLPVEQFMRDYFHHTAHVWRMTHRLSEVMQPASRMSRMLEPMLGRKTEDDYQIGKHEVSATPRATARLEQH